MRVLEDETEVVVLASISLAARAQLQFVEQACGVGGTLREVLDLLDQAEKVAQSTRRVRSDTRVVVPRHVGRHVRASGEGAEAPSALITTPSGASVGNAMTSLML